MAQAQSRDSQIDAALNTGIEHMKSHAETMKKVGAASDALNKHRKLVQKHAATQWSGMIGAPQKGAKKNTRKAVSTKQGG